MDRVTQNRVIESCVSYVKTTLIDAEKGHDWAHTERVWKMSKNLASTEICNPFIVELGALLHDIADPKFHAGDSTIGIEKAKFFLAKTPLDLQDQQRVLDIVDRVSFSKSFEDNKAISSELAIVQDADRLDAIGAIGIARTFHYGGFKNRAIYDPDVPVQNYQDQATYHKSDAPTINHFYEKLLLLRKMMHTESGKRIAEERHQFMEAFLKQFFKEWNAE